MSTSQKHVDRHLLLIGCGTVGSCFLDILKADREFKFDSVTVLAKDTPKDGVIPEWARLEIQDLTEDNYEDVLAAHCPPGSICLNLSVLGSLDLLIWCQEHDVDYMDTSGEDWLAADDEVNADDRNDIEEFCLYKMHKTLKERVQKMKEENHLKKEWPTAVLYHGMNPGIVNQCMKRGLMDIAEAVLKLPDCKNRVAIEEARKRVDFAALSHALGVKVMHVAERDSQTSSRPRYPGEFASTWSVDGFIEELKCYSELALGTHEKTVPSNATVWDEGASVALGSKGATTRIFSWVPSGNTLGFLTTHDEVQTMSRFLTVYDNKGNLQYRPTILFSYMPTDLSVASIHEFVTNGYTEMKEVFIGEDTILSGKDEVGVLFLGHELGSWWTGSTMSIDDARKVVPGHSPTTVQVCAGVVSGLHWLLENPTKGICTPEAIDHDFALEKGRPYLEPFVSIKGNFDPLDRTMLHFFDYEETFGPIDDEVNHSWMPTDEEKYQLAIFLQGPRTSKLKPNPYYVSPPTENSALSNKVSDQTKLKAGSDLVANFHGSRSASVLDVLFPNLNDDDHIEINK